MFTLKSNFFKNTVLKLNKVIYHPTTPQIDTSYFKIKNFPQALNFSLGFEKDKMCLAEFKINVVNEEITELKNNLINLSFDKKCIKDSQKLYLNKLNVWSSKLFTHNVVAAEINNENRWGCIPCTSKPWDVGKIEFPHTSTLSSGLYNGSTIIKTMPVVRIGNYSYYLSSKKYICNKDFLQPLTNKKFVKFTKGDNNMQSVYFDQALNIFNNNESPLIIKSYGLENIYDVVEYNFLSGELIEVEWNSFILEYNKYDNKIKVLLKQAGISFDNNE